MRDVLKMQAECLTEVGKRESDIQLRIFNVLIVQVQEERKGSEFI